jgi:hypothetical protein
MTLVIIFLHADLEDTLPGMLTQNDKAMLCDAFRSKQRQRCQRALSADFHSSPWSVSPQNTSLNGRHSDIKRLPIRCMTGQEWSVRPRRCSSTDDDANCNFNHSKPVSEVMRQYQPSHCFDCRCKFGSQSDAISVEVKHKLRVLDVVSAVDIFTLDPYQTDPHQHREQQQQHHSNSVDLERPVSCSLCRFWFCHHCVRSNQPSSTSPNAQKRVCLSCLKWAQDGT